MSVDSYHHARHEVIFQVVASDRHPARPIGRRRRILYYDMDDVDGVVGVVVWLVFVIVEARRGSRRAGRNPIPDRWRQFAMVCRFSSYYNSTLSPRCFSILEETSHASTR